MRDFAERVEKAGFEYMLTGSMAMIKYAMPRYTMNIDIVIDLNAQDAAKIIEILEPDYYVPHQAVKLAISKKECLMLFTKTVSLKLIASSKKHRFPIERLCKS